MPPEHHLPEWPDKVVYAALLLIVGGALGILFAVLEMAGASINVGGLVFLDEVPATWALGLSAATLVLGGIGLRYQAWVWCSLGIVTAVLSMGALGVLPLTGLVAAVSLVKARIENEEMKHDDRKVHAWEWPDKAIVASMFFTSLGLIAAVESVLAFIGHYSAPYFDAAPGVVGTLALVTALLAMSAARACFHQRSAWLAWSAGVVGVVTLPFWIIGPVLAALGMLFLVLAGQEGEFTTPAPAVDG